MKRLAIPVLVLGLLLGCSGAGGGPGADTVADTACVEPCRDVLEAGADAVPDAEVGPFPALQPFREMQGKLVRNKLRFVVDAGLEGTFDAEDLRQYALSRTLREADDYTTLTTQDPWWDDYQDTAESLYYSAEHVFGEGAPYAGETFSPHIWPDVTYGVSDVVVEYADLSGFYAAGEDGAISRTDPGGTAWHLLSANQAFEWARQRYATDPDEMLVLVADTPAFHAGPTSYFFVERGYADERGWDAYYFNTPFNEWPSDMQQAEGLKPHDLPIWMHLAFLNGEWDEPSKSWRLFPNGRWGGYDGSPIYVIEHALNAGIPRAVCDPMPFPASHFRNDEVAWKRCLGPTERLQYDWYRLWRHAFHVPSFPFWWSQKVDLRVVLVDLRDRDAQGQPEYQVEQVIDWQTFEDSVLQANPQLNLTVQKYLYTPPDDVKQVLLNYMLGEAKYPFHARGALRKTDGSEKEFHLDWHHHVDLPGLPGLQVYLATQLAEAYFGGLDQDGKPKDYDPFARPYSETGVPFLMPALFWLTPFGSYQGTIGGWTANTGELMCIFARQFGVSCEQLQATMEKEFGQPVGPNLNDWSNAYGFWWEVFVVDWTYATSPIKTLRWILDPAPFKELVEAVPSFGPALFVLAPQLFEKFFGWVHPWTSGYPVWARESLSDPDIREWTRQFTSYQFAETIQHNIGYKHQTTVIFDCPYLGMEDGFDYRKHHDLKETFDMTVEQASMPFYSTEPGSRDFVIDANTYLTHKMGAGTRHMLGRVFARRELMALYRALEEADPTFQSADAEFREAAEHYQRASTEALGWRHALAQEKARLGLEAMDRWFTAHGEPDRLHTDWDADVTFTPVKQGFASGAAGLEQELKRLSGK